jgi:hypothetical protein
LLYLNFLSNLSKRNPRQVWKYIIKFKKDSKPDSSDISIHEFAEYFKILLYLNQSDSVFHDDTPLRNENVIIDDRDRHFTVDEVCRIISSLNRHKSYDYDKNDADFFY